MNLRVKYLIDRLVGRPLVIALNLLAYPLGKILRRNHALDPNRVIVLCKLMGLGSIVQITPLITALHGGFPNARLVFLTRQQNLAYCERIDVIDETIVIDDSSVFRLIATIIRALRQMWRLRADLFINLEVYSNIGSLLAITSCARNRLGYYMTSHDQRAWGIYTHMVYFNRSAPISEVYLQAARCLGINVLGRSLIKPRIEASDEEILCGKLAALGVPDMPYLVVNPNSSELSQERRWPLRYFADVLVTFNRSHPDLRIFIVGSYDEKATGDELCRYLSSGLPVTDLTGNLSLIELMVLLRDARAFLSNDSGPMHLAFSLAVPTVGLFGPVSPEHYGSITDPSRILLSRHLYCSPCVHHFLEAPCGGDNQCMKLISPAEVAVALESVLAGRTTSGREEPLRYLDRNVVFGGLSRAGKRAAP